MQNPGDSLRLFIALDLPGEVAKNIARLVRDLAGRLEGVRWTPNANLHLTLKFLGRVETECVPRIQNCLDRAAGRHLPLALSLGGLGAFPGGRNPRVIWTGVGEGREKLVGLAEDLDHGLAELGFPREVRNYNPHLTLGRVKSGRSFSANIFRREIERRERESLGAFNPDVIVLFKSTLTPKGAIHRIVSRHRAKDQMNHNVKTEPA